MANNPRKGPPPKAIGFRAPPDLAQWLKEQAEANQRTVSNQAVYALQQYRKQLEAQGETT